MGRRQIELLIVLTGKYSLFTRQALADLCTLWWKSVEILCSDWWKKVYAITTWHDK